MKPCLKAFFLSVFSFFICGHIFADSFFDEFVAGHPWSDWFGSYNRYEHMTVGVIDSTATYRSPGSNTIYFAVNPGSHLHIKFTSYVFGSNCTQGWIDAYSPVSTQVLWRSQTQGNDGATNKTSYNYIDLSDTTTVKITCRYLSAGTAYDEDNGSATYNIVKDTTAPDGFGVSGNKPHEWNNAANTYTFYASDNTGGCGIGSYQWSTDNSTWNSGNSFTADRAGIYYLKAIDNLGNVGICTSYYYYYEVVPPTAPTLTKSIKPNDDGWTNGAVTITASGSVDSGGSDLAGYKFTTNPASWPSTVTGSSFTVNAQGATTVYCRAVDKAGNESATVSTTISIDTTNPSIPTLTATTNGWSREAVTVAASSNDNPSGIASYAFSTDNVTWKTQTSARYEITAEGETTVYCMATDKAGNKSGISSTLVKIDITQPSDPILIATANGWSTAAVAVTASSDDYISGIASYAFSADNSLWSSQASAQYVVNNQGATTIYCKAVDRAGNASNIVSTTVRIDSAPPVITDYRVGFSSDYSSVVISWTVNDKDCGIKQCELNSEYLGTIIAISPSCIQKTIRSVSSDQTEVYVADYTATLALATFPAWYGEVLTYSLTASDNLNNATLQTSDMTLRITIPPLIRFATTVVPYGEGSTQSEQAGQEYMEVDLNFGVSRRHLATLASLNITRTLASTTPTSVSLPDLTIDPSSIPSSIGASSQTSPDGNPWKEDSSGNVIYVDYVPVSSGAGHKAWTYAATAYRVGGSLWPVIVDPTHDVILPNNKGTIAFAADYILDGNGNSAASPSFSIGGAGNVQLRLVGIDGDRDTMHVKVYKVRKVPGSSYSFTSYAVLSGSSPIEHAYPYIDASTPLLLSPGDNNIQIFWSEGDSSQVFNSSILDLVLAQSSGGYSLTIMDGYGNQITDLSSGIVCAPYQPLILSIGTSAGSSTDSTSWTFGDGDSDSGQSVTHKYSQKADQVEANCTYSLVITLPDASTMTVPVTVRDTQEGELWGPETWRGPHTVLGTVVVPSGIKLTIATNSEVTSQIVSFKGDLVSGYNQGITVESGGILSVDGGVTFRSATGQTEGWGAILIKGQTSIGSLAGESVVIANADRGIAVDQGGSATIANTTFMQNVTGLHVVGSTSVKLDSCTLSNNSLYAIKEDAGGRPVIVNSAFSSNFHNYYQWDGGVIGIDDLNMLNGLLNSGNSGE